MKLSEIVAFMTEAQPHNGLMLSGRHVLLFMAVAVCGRVAQTRSHTSEPFLIDPDRPMTYLAVDHVGTATPRPGGHLRIWLQFHNNCNIPIELHAHGAPLEAPEDELTLMYEIVQPVNRGVKVFTDSDPADVLAKSEPPPGTMSEVGSSFAVLPGKAVLFSVPIEEFSTHWEFHIPFRLQLPRGNKPRDENAWGGEPEMFLEYSFWDLPAGTQKQLKSKLPK
jgi:hypothetical protein